MPYVEHEFSQGPGFDGGEVLSSELIDPGLIPRMMQVCIAGR